MLLEVYPDQVLHSLLIYLHILMAVFYARTSLLEILGVYNKVTGFVSPYEPRCEKTGLRGFRPGLTQTGLCNHLIRLEA